jgi:Chromo (CHRromatin Organisation MOdifier) domain
MPRRARLLKANSINSEPIFSLTNHTLQLSSNSVTKQDFLFSFSPLCYSNFSPVFSGWFPMVVASGGMASSSPFAPRGKEPENDVPDDGSEVDEVWSDGEKLYHVDCIVAENKGSTKPYLVQWVGYGLGDCTWEPAKGLPQEFIDEWKKRKEMIENGEINPKPFDMKAYEAAKVEAEKARPQRNINRALKRIKLGLGNVWPSYLGHIPDEVRRAKGRSRTGSPSKKTNSKVTQIAAESDSEDDAPLKQRRLSQKHKCQTSDGSDVPLSKKRLPFRQASDDSDDIPLRHRRHLDIGASRSKTITPQERLDPESSSSSDTDEDENLQLKLSRFEWKKPATPPGEKAFKPRRKPILTTQKDDPQSLKPGEGLGVTRFLVPPQPLPARPVSELAARPVPEAKTGKWDIPHICRIINTLTLTTVNSFMSGKWAEAPKTRPHHVDQQDRRFNNLSHIHNAMKKSAVEPVISADAIQLRDLATGAIVSEPSPAATALYARRPSLPQISIEKNDEHARIPLMCPYYAQKAVCPFNPPEHEPCPFLHRDETQGRASYELHEMWREFVAGRDLRPKWDKANPTVCPFWRKNGRCRFSDETCWHAHWNPIGQTHPAQPANDPPKNKTCFFWLKGSCRLPKDRCKFAHEMKNEVADPPRGWDDTRGDHPRRRVPLGSLPAPKGEYTYMEDVLSLPPPAESAPPPPNVPDPRRRFSLGSLPIPRDEDTHMEDAPPPAVNSEYAPLLPPLPDQARVLPQSASALAAEIRIPNNYLKPYMAAALPGQSLPTTDGSRCRFGDQHVLKAIIKIPNGEDVRNFIASRADDPIRIDWLDVSIELDVDLHRYFHAKHLHLPNATILGAVEASADMQDQQGWLNCVAQLIQHIGVAVVNFEGFSMLLYHPSVAQRFTGLKIPAMHTTTPIMGVCFFGRGADRVSREIPTRPMKQEPTISKGKQKPVSSQSEPLNLNKLCALKCNIAPEGFFKSNQREHMNVMLMFKPGERKLDAALWTRFFSEAGALVYNRDNGGWLEFSRRSKVREGAIVFPAEFVAYHKVPKLAAMLLKGYKIWQFGVEALDNEETVQVPQGIPNNEGIQVSPEYRVVSLFPNGTTVLILDDVIKNHPEDAAQVINSLSKENSHKRRGWGPTWRLLCRPGVKNWIYYTLVQGYYNMELEDNPGQVLYLLTSLPITALHDDNLAPDLRSLQSLQGCTNVLVESTTATSLAASEYHEGST